MNWPHLWGMMQAFHAAVQPAHGLNEADAKATMEAIEAHGFLKVTSGGFFAGTADANPLNRSEVFGREFLWWSQDGTGALLQRDFRRWCHDQGASLIYWSCPPQSARVRRFYSKFAAECEAVYVEAL